MDRLTGIVSFVRTAETSSFVAAGRHLGISASAVGKNVAKLEEKLGVRLFHRTTRRVRLTTEGALYYERCHRILDDLDEAENVVTDASQAPRGLLRISTPTVGYRFLLPILPEFTALYPEIELDLDFDDRMVDVIEEGFDAVIRSGNLRDSQLGSRRLGAFRFFLCASPEYLRAHGIPRSIEELERHRQIHFRIPSTGKLQEWQLKRARAERPLRARTVLTCNNCEGLLMGALEGLGIAYMPDFLAREALDDGRLVSVLDTLLVNPHRFWLLWPSSRRLSPKLRAFVDFASSRLFAPRPASERESLRRR